MVSGGVGSATLSEVVSTTSAQCVGVAADRGVSLSEQILNRQKGELSIPDI